MRTVVEGEPKQALYFVVQHLVRGVNIPHLATPLPYIQGYVVYLQLVSLVPVPKYLCAMAVLRRCNPRLFLCKCP